MTAGNGRQGGPDPLDGGSGARQTLADARERGEWQLRANANACVRGLDEPAPTITAGHDSGERVWLRSGQSVAGEGRAERSADEPSLTIIARTDLCEWVTERPATTVNGDPRISEPGHHDSAVSGSQQANAVRVSLAEAACLQGFPDGHPWMAAGSKTAAFRCIGNAIPPAMALAALRAVRAGAASRGNRDLREAA